MDDNSGRFAMKARLSRIHHGQVRLAALATTLLSLSACGGSVSDENGALVLAPIQVTPELAFTAIGVGFGHVCAVATNGGTYCWGKNEYGVLGSTAAMSVCLLPISEGGFPCSGSPVLVESSPMLVDVGGSTNHSCGVDRSGSPSCWGFGLGGQLGDGGRQNSTHPVAVAGGHAFQMISVGGNSGMSCGVTPNGAVLCWGIGLLGDGTEEGSDVPVPVAVPEPMTGITVGATHACALGAEGRVYCWGNNWFGQLGVGSAGGLEGLADALLPVAVVGDLSFVAISAGGMHTCALTDSGSAYCWGAGDLVGTAGDIGYVSAPVAVSGGHTFVAISSGYDHSCGLTAEGQGLCWGSNLVGQLGDGTTTDRVSPWPVDQGQVRFRQIVAGGNTCALAQDGTAYCWGPNPFGQCGRPGYEVLR
jgi:alpha-tubulin suppressor-like RCC1 family protein